MCSFFLLLSNDVPKNHIGTQYGQVLKIKWLGLVLVPSLVLTADSCIHCKLAVILMDLSYLEITWF